MYPSTTPALTLFAMPSGRTAKKKPYIGMPINSAGAGGKTRRPESIGVWNKGCRT